VATALVLSACSSTEAPKARRALRSVPLTSAADLEAFDVADAANDQLNMWCAEALELRDLGEELAIDDPVLDGRAADQVERIRVESVELAESPELVALLASLGEAHGERLAALAKPGKFPVKRHLRAERRVVELGFGLRRWRLQR
jgi:hypothetical protein